MIIKCYGAADTRGASTTQVLVNSERGADARADGRSGSRPTGAWLRPVRDMEALPGRCARASAPKHILWDTHTVRGAPRTPSWNTAMEALPWHTWRGHVILHDMHQFKASLCCGSSKLAPELSLNGDPDLGPDPNSDPDKIPTPSALDQGAQL